MIKVQTFSTRILHHLTITSVLFFVFGSFSIYASSMSPGWNSLGGEQAQEAAITATPVATSAMTVSFTLPGFSSEQTALNSENWQNISFVGQREPDVIGAPRLPLMWRYIAVPRNASVTIEMVDVKFRNFENVKIQPFQKPLLETESAATRAFSINQKIYSTNAFYPAAWATTSETVVMRGVHMAALVVNPLRYNPVTRMMQVASHITLKVTYTNPNPGMVQTFPAHLANSFKGLLLNYGFMGYRMVPTLARDNKVRATDYLIVTDDDFINSSSLNNLVSYHTGQGRTVEVKGASSLNNSADDIKDYIETLYNSNELDYVLLIGDLPAIPHKSNAYSSYDSDSWYSWVDGSDQVGDVGLGRLPATDQAELDDMVMKTLNFHTIAEPGEWRKKSVLVAHRENAPDKYTACKNRIYDYDYQLEAPTMDKLFGTDGATNSQVTDAINEGRIVVNYRGHGSSTAWTGWNGSSYSTSQATGLENGKKTPVIFSICCNNGEMSKSSHCLAEAFMCQDQGAVAILAATAPSYTSVNHDYDEALYQALWDEGIEAYGDVRNYADGQIGTSSTAKSNSAMYVTFGDPTVNVLQGSSVPFTTLFAPNGKEQWEQGTTQEITWGDNISGEVKIEIFKGGSLKEVLVATTASDGSFEWQIAADYTAGDDYKMKITSIDSSALNDDSDDDFSIVPEFIIMCPYFQNFDTLESGTEILPYKYEQVSDDDLNWLVLAGPTPSRVDDPPDVTGPAADHTTGTSQGNYIYTEASASNSGNPDKQFTYLTPKFNFKALNSPELTFWYHMLSDNAGEDHMGDLMVDINVDGTWNNDVITISGNKGDNWLEQKLDLTPYKGDRVIFRFRGVTGDSWESDISIDDFKIDGEIPITNFIGTFPVSFNLMQKGPRILFRVPKNGKNASHVSLKLYNLQGKLVSTLVNGNVKAGNYSIPLGKVDNTGQRIATGMYLCRMEAEGFIKTINVLNRK